MEYALAVFCGVIYGGAIGVCKYLFLWRKVIKAKDDEEIKIGSIYIRMGVSYAVNIIALLIIYLLRNTIPLNFVWFIVSAAISLSLAGRMSSLTRLYKKDRKTS